MNDKTRALDDVIRKIVYNKKIRDIMLNLIDDPYIDIVQFQDSECKGMTQTKTGRPSLSKEGFQIGEPFCGDIEKAPVLFLSSNPAFNFDEVSPRYFPVSDKTSLGKIFMPKHIASAKKAGQEAGIWDKGYSFEKIIEKIRKKFTDFREKISFEEVHKEIQEIFTVPRREMNLEEVREFFKTRIQTSPARNKDDEKLYIPLKNGEITPVDYWTCVKTNTELILPSKLKASWKALTLSQRAREIMMYAVCMEIVPFRSNSEIGVNKVLLDECWNEYTSDLLELSGAKVIVLVGNKVLDVFTQKLNLNDNVKNALKNHGTKKILVGHEQRTVVKVDFNSGKFSRFDNSKLFSAAVLKDLRDAVASSPFVTKAIAALSIATANAGSD